MGKMPDPNMFIIGGRLTRDPILGNTPTGIKFIKFTIANNRGSDKEGNEKEANFFDCIAWKGTAESICKCLTKGSKILAEGYTEQKRWEDKEKKKRSAIEYVCLKVYFLDGKNKTHSENNESNYSAQDSFYESSGDSGELPLV